jgi:hypothetical protein
MWMMSGSGSILINLLLNPGKRQISAPPRREALKYSIETPSIRTGRSTGTSDTVEPSIFDVNTLTWCPSEASPAQSPWTDRMVPP